MQILRELVTTVCTAEASYCAH